MPASALTFRNSHGELVDVPSVAATELKNKFGTVLEQVTRNGAVAITRHDKTSGVLLSFDEFKSLVQAQSRSLEDLSAEYDTLLAGMQKPGARKKMAAAFNATPAELGRAAVESARKRR